MWGDGTSREGTDAQVMASQAEWMGENGPVKDEAV